MDKLTEMEVFSTVVDAGGFTVAAKRMGISKSAVSKHIASLETRLGARLLNRTTRRVSPTEIGMLYYERIQKVLSDAGEADALVSSMQSDPSGTLRISVGTDFGVNHISPILGEFLRIYPKIDVSMSLSNRYVDLISEGYDLAVRVGELEDSSLKVRKIAETGKRLVASPDYIAKYGRPAHVDDLQRHSLLQYSQDNAISGWRLMDEKGEKRVIRTTGSFSVNNGQALLNAAISGLGIAYLPGFLCADAIGAGFVTDVMPDLPHDIVGIYAVYPPGRYVQPKVRSFIDFLLRSFADKGPYTW